MRSMPNRLARALAALLALAVAWQPVAAIPDEAPALGAEPLAIIAPLPAAATFEAQRHLVRQRLIELGDDPAAADASVAWLTPADLAVLGANPAMLQRAGGSSVTTTTIIIWAIIIAGIVILFIVSDNGFIIQN